jgi:hypothetical protein
LNGFLNMEFEAFVPFLPCWRTDSPVAVLTCLSRD